MLRTTAFVLSWCCFIGVASAAPEPKPGLPAIQHPMTMLAPIATFPIARHDADWVAITPDAVWVAGKGPNVVHRIDPATNTDTMTVPLPGGACAGLAAGFDSLWVPICADDKRIPTGGARYFSLKSSDLSQQNS